MFGDHGGVSALTPQLLDLLVEPVLCCNLEGRILYANAAAQHWYTDTLVGQQFAVLLAPGSEAKGQAFFAAAYAASPSEPTPYWELGLFHNNTYTMINVRGYASHDQIVILGNIESEQLASMQRELVALNADLSDAQRDLHRQNQVLQQALHDQRRLLQTIQELSAPAVPIWRGALLLPLVGNIDSLRAKQITAQLLERIVAEQAHFIILDVSGIATIDTAVARYLLEAAQAARLLGAQTLLVGVSPEIAQTIVSLGVELHGLITLSNLQHAMAYILHRLGGFRL